MPLYELTEGAASDIHATARYTVRTWGIDQVHRYESLLENHFQAIGSGKARTRQFDNIQSFIEWAGNLPKGKPLLSGKAIHRRSIYEG